MTKNKIAIQGELGAYSHIAAKDLFKDAEIKTCATFEETFKQAHEDENYKIIIPIENSLAGRVADMAGSAKDLAEGKDKSIAAIASNLSAEIYKLKILEKNIEDEKGNVTRFLIMGKKIEQPEFDENKKFITSCIFRVKSEPSALYKCLGGFATNHVNLTKLESFSVKNTFDQANFYLDLEGHLDEFGVKKAMEELGFHTVNLHILGVYEASAFRQK